MVRKIYLKVGGGHSLKEAFSFSSTSSSHSEYFCEHYGECKVLHTWEFEGTEEQHDADGVPLQDKFAIVLRFREPSTANRVKQK